ncbi:DNA photolyase family protein [Bdellovibrio sp. SKB1291214]|uniref:cryptochrome/photolyase family protein n=1 Tax=Bdellovibrio sp. SKB1291214 TaxID=1732569 RepID=UPI0020CBED51|nr:deoxyribodipyrimidine photo-lyase [Bdellovibrio sp. SKB1291214]UYL08327.1 DNA photolyase family protein [Bdellovibrio sp. SKB1291214]
MVIFWFRRDLRMNDNAGLFHALKDGNQIQPLFIFDSDILDKLEDTKDARVTFIYDTVASLKKNLQELKSDLWVRHGKPLEIFKDLLSQHQITAIYTNHDYEPYARKRDEEVSKLAKSKGVEFKTFKDQTLFEKDEILTSQGKPYTVYTPYKNNVLKTLNEFYLKSYPTETYKNSYSKIKKVEAMPTLQSLGFERTSIEFPPMKVSTKLLKNYANTRDIPSQEGGTSHLGMHLRFGTLSVRELAREGLKYSPVWLSELIWRDFFMQILWHYPEVEKRSFRPEYDKIAWRNSKADFNKWSEGKTGYPLVDAGMRELNATGFMHNRVRMVVASFLCKHLLIHWYEGERYFAKKLLDYDLAANNGNWQWAAGSGCDAAPYFRIFNPEAQAKRFDPNEEYIKKWVPEYGTDKYPEPMIDHNEARGRCLQAFTKALKK